MPSITWPLTRPLTHPATGPADGVLTAPSGYAWVYVLDTNGAAVGLFSVIDGVAYPIYAEVPR